MISKRKKSQIYISALKILPANSKQLSNRYFYPVIFFELVCIFPSNFFLPRSGVSSNGFCGNFKGMFSGDLGHAQFKFVAPLVDPIELIPYLHNISEVWRATRTWSSSTGVQKQLDFLLHTVFSYRFFLLSWRFVVPFSAQLSSFYFSSSWAGNFLSSPACVEPGQLFIYTIGYIFIKKMFNAVLIYVSFCGCSTFFLSHNLSSLFFNLKIGWSGHYSRS